MNSFFERALLKVFSLYKDVRYFFGPKIYVGRAGEYRTFEEATKHIEKKYTNVVLVFSNGKRQKIKM